MSVDTTCLGVRSHDQVLAILRHFGRPARRVELEPWSCCSEHLLTGLRVARKQNLVTARGYGAGTEYQLTNEGQDHGH